MSQGVVVDHAHEVALDPAVRGQVAEHVEHEAFASSVASSDFIEVFSTMVPRSMIAMLRHRLSASSR
jgi:hypothetical protein